MREVVFKHLTSIEARKKNIFLTEVYEKDGVIARTERRCFYFIKDITYLQDEKALQKWLKEKGHNGPINRKHFNIYRRHDDALGEDKVSCKMAGTFYVIANNTVYTIAFLQSFKMRFLKEDIAK